MFNNQSVNLYSKKEPETNQKFYVAWEHIFSSIHFIHRLMVRLQL